MQIMLSKKYTYILRNRNVRDAKNVKIHFINFIDELY